MNNNDNWNLNEYIEYWTEYLKRNIERFDNSDPERTKYVRQLDELMIFKYGASMNIKLNHILQKVYNGTYSDEQSANKHKKNDINLIQHDLSINPDDNPIVKSLSNKDIFCIQGPPGTGKTTIITEIVLQLLKANPDSRILICSETHVAVDNALLRISAEVKRLNWDNVKICRYPKYNDSTAISGDDCTSFSYHLGTACNDIQSNDLYLAKNIATYVKKENGYDREFEKLVISKMNVLGITCNQLARFKMAGSLDIPYDVAIVDEVSKATFPEIIIPLNRCKKAILVGDPMQLPPTFCREEIEIMDILSSEQQETTDYIINKSVVDRIFNKIDKEAISFLDTQYRMSEQIGDIISSLFYEGKLKNGRHYSDQNSVEWLDYKTKEKFPKKPIQDGGILQNEIEARIIIKTIKDRFINKTNKFIAIITPYIKQKTYIENLLNKLNIIDKQHYEVNTIDAYQGREADIVFISFVRNNGSGRFFSDLRRLNVAISRSKDKVFFVGMMQYLEQHLRNLVPLMKNVHLVDITEYDEMLIKLIE